MNMRGSMIILLVGLGNPGEQYMLNRHNVGFMAVDVISHIYSFSAAKRHGKALLQEGVVNGQKVLLLKPLTFMNLSGHAVAEVASFYKILPEHIIVFHDDLDLALYKIRVKQGGRHGGHNGLRSLDACIGKDYWRVRIGIDRPEDKSRVSDYVLNNFPKAEQDDLADLLGGIADELPSLLADKKELFTTRMAQILVKEQ